MLVPQVVPAALLVLATHWDAPVEQEVAPFWHGLLGWHEVPAVQATQVALPLQTMLVPQLVPAGWLPFAVHCAVPVEQDNVPVWHGLLLGVHGLPSAQAPQAPLLQTFPLPQSVPLAIGLQVPVEHELHVPQVATLQQIPERQCPC